MLLITKQSLKRTNATIEAKSTIPCECVTGAVFCQGAQNLQAHHSVLHCFSLHTRVSKVNSNKYFQLFIMRIECRLLDIFIFLTLSTKAIVSGWHSEEHVNVQNRTSSKGLCKQLLQIYLRLTPSICCFV